MAALFLSSKRESVVADSCSRFAVRSVSVGLLLERCQKPPIGRLLQHVFRCTDEKTFTRNKRTFVRAATNLAGGIMRDHIEDK